jgi:diguanylate cyclase (GGDEF)-like protein
VRKLGLPTKVGILSILFTAALGVVLWRTLGNTVTDHIVTRVRSEARLLTDIGIAPNVSGGSLADGLDATEQADLDQALGSLQEAPRDRVVRIWSATPELVYSSPGVLFTGANPPESGRLNAAIAGEESARIVTADVADDIAPGDRVLSIYVPLKSDSDVVSDGIVEIRIPYEPISAKINEDSNRIALIIAAGFLTLVLIILRIVDRASKRLRTEVADHQRQALHDPLTGLPNRTLFRDRVHQSIKQASRNKSVLAVMLLDLDRFKEINDTLGHHYGDLLLQQIGPRLTKLLRDTDSVARLGGDEFAVLMINVPDPTAVVHVADKIRRELQKPFRVQGLSLHADASIGIAVHPHHGSDVDTLLQRADVAMYMAKAGGTGRELYTADRDENSPGRLALMGELSHAIDAGELVLHYQPKVHLRTGEVKGVEALVRWNHPMRGLLPSGEFVPIAENTGLIEPLTMDTLRMAIKQARGWLDEGRELTVSVNLSVRSLLHTNLAREVEFLLTRFKVPPHNLELEITESSIMADPTRARATLVQLASMGVRLSIDDFGTGHSSLAYLKRLPVHALKIDKSFVINMASDDNDLVIVQSTIDLAHNLGLEVVAEGVESEEVWNRLRSLGCDMAQGFWRGRPVKAEELAFAVDIIELAAGQ